jgi:alginate O-acetyltransferase complex protein AlgI
MIFNTAWFVLFFPIVIAMLWLIPGRMPRFYFLLAASAVFHAHFAGPAGVAPIVAMAIAVYFIAKRLETAEGADRRHWLRIGLAVPVLGLAWYKYRVFLATSLMAAIPGLSGPLQWLAQASPMPLAISFFTFEFVHYLVEIFRGGQAIRRPAHFALFCIYFPSIVSGPIKRYSQFCPQVEDGLAHPSQGKGLEGLAQLVLGFFKKMVVADNVNAILGLMEARSSWHPWHVALLMGLLSVRILFDFSGYSDIAIGLSKIIGLDLPANFNFPYLASDIQDFWRRWHMSLSSWIRDYIYIPLGGSRQGAARKSFNALVAMALCGLWHGAAWNFVAWGIYHGLGMAVHGAYRRRWPDAGGHSLIYLGCAHALTLAFVGYGWLLFFFPMDKVLWYSRCLIGLAG